MARAIVVGVVGDSGAGKTTITRGLTLVLGDKHVTYISADDYHRYDRARRRSSASLRSTLIATTSTS